MKTLSAANVQWVRSPVGNSVLFDLINVCFFFQIMVTFCGGNLNGFDISNHAAATSALHPRYRTATAMRS